MEYGNGTTNQLSWKVNKNRYHNQDFDITEDNPNVNVSILSKYVNENDRILDFGCGEGKFGAVLKKKNLLIGIDLDETAAIYAKEHYGYNNVFTFNLEDTNSIPESFLKYSDVNNRFDVIVLLDILEHLMNPSDILSKLVKYLKDEGKILISVPNVNNADIFLNLLRDHFNYRESGVLDNTHVKYFTKTSFVEWINEMNKTNEWSMDCEYIGSVYGYTEYLEQVKKLLPALYNFVQLNPYFHVMQHLFILTFFENKRETQQLNKLLSDKPEDLTNRLNEIIERSEEKNNMFDIKLLSNERKIMEERFEVAQKGWEECSRSLEQLNKYTMRKEKELSELKEYIASLEKNITKSTTKFGRIKHNEK